MARAANYLSVGQIYLRDNAMLDRPLTIADVKPRLLGHWGTTPGLNFLYVHLIPADRRACGMRRIRPGTAAVPVDPTPLTTHIRIVSTLRRRVLRSQPGSAGYRLCEPRFSSRSNRRKPAHDVSSTA